MVTPYQVYTEYLALKSHFTNKNYDYFKYNKKVRASITSFNRRTDKYWFEKTSRKYKDEEIVDFFVSNFVQSESNSNIWIGSLINEGEKVYSEWKKRQQSLSYLFKEQSTELFSETELENVFKCCKGHPPVLKKFLSGKLSLETFIIYERIFQFAKDFDKKLIDPVWETVSMKIKKYSPFLLHINILQYKKILRDIINE
jgi:hypothetical protein